MPGAGCGDPSEEADPAPAFMAQRLEQTEEKSHLKCIGESAMMEETRHGCGSREERPPQLGSSQGRLSGRGDLGTAIPVR